MTSSSDDDEDDTLFQSHYHPPSPSSSSSPSPPPTAHPSNAARTSQTNLPHNFFAPPFYNRPPTPLPPSPSLTSLLRPSRPTTPDSSDNDPGHIGTRSGRHQPVPRASPKVPTYEYYGFVLYLASSACFAMYILWSYLPSPFLHALGIYYYPNRWWSLAIPAWLVMFLVYIYCALAAYNTGTLTLGLGELGTVVDEAANVAVVDGAGRIRSSFLVEGPLKGKEKGMRRRKRHKKVRAGGGSRDSKFEAGGFRGMGDKKWDWKEVWSEGTDAVMDVPLGGVCEVLYGDGREDQFHEEG